MSTNQQMLGEVPLFALLDDHERTVLAERVEVVRFPAGHVLYNYGDPGDSMFVIKRGKVEVFVKTKTGERLVLERPAKGDFFGELSLLDSGPRSASAVVIEELEALRVDRGDLDELIRLQPAAALDLLSAAGKRLRQVSLLLRNAATRNANEEIADTRSTAMKVADWISAFSGSMTFLFIHLVIFAVWILLNVRLGSLAPLAPFDPFPFGLLTMVVSLEAIILSVFVLLSQNRQAAREHLRSDVEYDVNLRAEMQIAHMHEKVDLMHAEILERLAQIEAAKR